MIWYVVCPLVKIQLLNPHKISIIMLCLFGGMHCMEVENEGPEKFAKLKQDVSRL